MGASSYRSSSYSRKGSTSPSRSESSIRQTYKVKETKGKTPMLEMLELLEEVERCRDVVTSREADLESAKKDLAKAEQKVSAQINKLDPETKARFRRMMGGLDEQGKGQANKEQDNER